MADTSAFKRRLARIPARVRADVMGVMEAAAGEVAQIMRVVGPDDRTFELERSIRVEPSPGELRVRIKAGGKRTTRAVREGSGVAYDYALAQEFGTENQAARPFFYPTWRLRRRSVRSKINRAIKRAVMDEARRQGLANG
jgi:HK97 gp10 family phage protein